MAVVTEKTTPYRATFLRNAVLKKPKVSNRFFSWVRLGISVDLSVLRKEGAEN